MNFLVKILASMPIILLTLYFIPFLGIILLLFRYFIYYDKKRIKTSLTLAGIGILILIPKILSSFFSFFKIDINFIPYLNSIINSELYTVDFINYSKFLISIGIIFLCLSFIFQKAFQKFLDFIKAYINKSEQINREIAKENDMEIRIKQEKAKTTNYVKCPNCGSDNIIASKTETCAYCRRIIVNEKSR